MKYSFDIDLGEEDDEDGFAHMVYCCGNTLNQCIITAEYYEMNQEGDLRGECALKYINPIWSDKYIKVIKKEFYKRYGRPSKLPKWF